MENYSSISENQYRISPIGVLFGFVFLQKVMAESQHEFVVHTLHFNLHNISLGNYRGYETDCISKL